MKLIAIDDDPLSLELITAALEQPELTLLSTSSPQEGLQLVQQHSPQVVLLDLMMPGLNGMEVLERIVAMDPAIDVILMTAQYSTDSAVEAIQRGASDYLTKPLDVPRLRERIARMLEEVQRRRRAAALDEQSAETFQFHGMIGRSPAMLELFDKIRRVAPHFRTALVVGATGTGKELVARALHELGSGSGKPFATCNCGAIVDTLIESELFGYVRGAFTGALQDKVGLFEFAHNGTVFLD